MVLNYNKDSNAVMQYCIKQKSKVAFCNMISTGKIQVTKSATK